MYEPEVNPYWNVIITMSTVGYGDIYPMTYYGRLFSIISMFLGQFVSSLILLGMSIASNLEMEEQKAYKKLKIIEYHTDQMKLAAHVIGIGTYIRLLNKGYRVKRFNKIGPIKALMQLQIQLELTLRSFKEAHKYTIITPVVSWQIKLAMISISS